MQLQMPHLQQSICSPTTETFLAYCHCHSTLLQAWRQSPCVRVHPVARQPRSERVPKTLEGTKDNRSTGFWAQYNIVHYSADKITNLRGVRAMIRWSNSSIKRLESNHLSIETYLHSVALQSRCGIRHRIDRGHHQKRQKLPHMHL